MSKDALAVADSVIVSEEFNPWPVFGDPCNQKVVSGLQFYQKKVVMRRKASLETSERWFGDPSAGLPSASASAGRGGVRIPNDVEEGQVDYVVVPEPAASSSRSVKSPVFGSKWKASASSGPKCRKHFEVSSPVTSLRKSQMNDPSFGSALDRDDSGSCRRSGRDRRALPIFAFSKKK